MTRIALTVNGRLVDATVAPRLSLADFLREELLLTGTHIGCEHGICGACTVEIDGGIARSCITLAVACDGASVRTIEGFDDDAVMARLRQAFTQEHALQCGYCTPGMLIAARDLVRRKGGLSRSEIRREMAGNLCRCTGYMGIVSAIARAMPADADGASPPPLTAPASDAGAWLGPPPGPATATRNGTAVGADGSRTGPAPPALTAPPPTSTAPPPAATAPAARPATARPPVAVTAGPLRVTGGLVRLSQSFTLDHPRQAVWALMVNPQALARCMPGASLDGPPDATGAFTGRIALKLGPIAASFAGEGRATPSPAEFRQLIEGRGGDRKSGSRVSGSVECRLEALAPGPAAPEQTRVHLEIGYALTGLLAQIGRSNLAQDLARRIGEAFAQNLDAALADPAGAAAPGAQPSPLAGLSLLRQVLARRLTALLARLLGRRG